MWMSERGKRMSIKRGSRLWDRHPHVRSGSELTFGEKAADKMRNGFGSWTFVGVFILFLALWMALNTLLLKKGAFDAYPYILLNLCLSCLAALQGALILIAAKRADRVAAEASVHHYDQTSATATITGDILKLQQQQMSILAQLQHIDAHLDAIEGTDPGTGAGTT